MNETAESFPRPKHKIDDGHAHIKFGEDPRPNLQKYGYCVVENVLTENECYNTIDEIWDWLEGLGTGIKRKDKSTWDNDHFPFSLRQGLIQHTMGQEEFAWKVREHPNVIQVYSQIFNTDKLLVSFCSVGVYRPIETGYVHGSNSSWLHTDQDIISGPLEEVYSGKDYSVQGIINLEDSEDKDAGFFVGEGSHLLHSKLFENNGSQPVQNWYVLTKQDVTFLQDHDIEFYKINAPKGSFTIFDSRAIHSGFPHQKGREIPRFRYTLYIAYSPADRATEKDINTKIQAVKEGKNTNHWSSCNIKIFPIPNNFAPYMTRKKNIPDWKNWSVRRKQLAGLIPYT